jgi:hypothetical protein
MEKDTVSKTLCSFMFLEYQMMDRVQKPSNPECNTLSSEPLESTQPFHRYTVQNSIHNFKYWPQLNSENEGNFHICFIYKEKHLAEI